MTHRRARACPLVSRVSRRLSASRVPYLPCRDAAAVPAILAGLAPRTAIVDIEPLVAVWDTDQAHLDAGIAAFVDACAEHAGGPANIVFATNAARRPSALPTGRRARVRYRSHAGKPFRAGPYRRLDRPGVVVGDQVATDGVLAWRLGVPFVHYIPDDPDMPVGPRLLRLLGRPLLRVLFRP